MPVRKEYKDVGTDDVVRVISGKHAGKIGVVTEREALNGKLSILARRVKVRFNDNIRVTKGQWINTKNIEVIEYVHYRRKKRNQ